MDGTALLPGWLRPELFPGIGVLPGPAFYNFFGHSVDRRTMHSHVQQRMQETVFHLKKGIVTRCVCAPVPVRYRGLAGGFRPVKHSFSIGKLTGAR